MSAIHPPAKASDAWQTHNLPILLGKVYSFEKEMMTKTQTVLLKIEDDIDVLCKNREQWIRKVSDSDDMEKEVFDKKTEILKKKAEIISIDLAVDSIKIRGFYEAQQLKQLIILTQPVEDFSNEKERQAQIEMMQRECLDELEDLLAEAVDRRLKLAVEAEDLSKSLDYVKIAYSESKKFRLEQLIRRVSEFIERIDSFSVTAQEKLKKVTGEYLIFRHNARVAKEILLMSQNEASKARKVLQENLDQLIQDAANQREKLESASLEELNMLTSDVRRAVIQREITLSNATTNATEKKTERINFLKNSRKALIEYRKKYDDLQLQRKENFKNNNSDLRRLRAMVSKLELNALALESNDVTAYNDLNSKYTDLKFPEEPSIDNLRSYTKSPRITAHMNTSQQHNNNDSRNYDNIDIDSGSVLDPPDTLLTSIDDEFKPKFESNPAKKSSNLDIFLSKERPINDLNIMKSRDQENLQKQRELVVGVIRSLNSMKTSYKKQKQKYKSKATDII